jgi:glycosyltransferase involved in cell wall biosynthesis
VSGGQMSANEWQGVGARASGSRPVEPRSSNSRGEGFDGKAANPGAAPTSLEAIFGGANDGYEIAKPAKVVAPIQAQPLAAKSPRPAAVPATKRPISQGDFGAETRDPRSRQVAAPAKTGGGVPRPGLRGNLDSVRDGNADGWAFDEAAPARRVRIEIWGDGALVAIGEASRERSDLRDAKVGDGSCAFLIPLPASLADGQEHTIVAKVSGSDHNFGSLKYAAPTKSAKAVIAPVGAPTPPAAGSPPRRVATDPYEAAPPTKRPIPPSDIGSGTAPAKLADGEPRPGLRGNLDSVRDGNADGWAFDEAAPAKRVRIEIWADGAPVAIGEASRERSDLRDAMVGDGSCAFLIPLPASLADGLEHTIVAKVSGSDHHLGSLKYAAPGGPRPAKSPPSVAAAVGAPTPPVAVSAPSRVAKDRSEAVSATKRPISRGVIGSGTAPAKLADGEPRPGLRGNLDSVRDGNADGWAFDETAPAKRVRIEIWADGVLVAIGEASRERSDLRDAKVGDGSCAFLIPLPASLADGQEHTIVAKVSGSDHQFGSLKYSALGRSTPAKSPPPAAALVIAEDQSEAVPAKKGPLSRGGAAAEARDPRSSLGGAPATSADGEARPGLRGNLDSVRDGDADGWAFDEAAPARRVRIEIWGDGVLVAVGEASRERSDLRDAKVGDGSCAFLIPLPTSLADGEEHMIVAKVSGSDHHLGSLKYVAQGRPTAEKSPTPAAEATSRKSLLEPPPPIQSVGLSEADLAIVADYFDEAFYVKQNPELQDAGFDLLRHYMTVGWKQRLDPSPRYSTDYYLRSNPDIVAAGLNPLLHYVRNGRQEMRPPAPYAAVRRANYRPLVSVIVPNFNHARFLLGRISSIYQQSYTNIELILLDDNSEDGSPTVLDELAEHSPFPVKKAYNKQNSGNVFSQWEKGFQMASGELVWICESDDFCEAEFLERLVPYFADRSVMMAFGRIQFCDTANRTIPGLDAYREQAEPAIWSEPLVRSAAEWFANGFGRKNVIANVGGCVIRKQEVDPAIWREARSYKICGDWFLYVQWAGGGRIAFDPRAISYFRQHGHNTSASNFDKLYFYQEHEKMFICLNRSWAIPSNTREGFVRSLDFMWRHYGLKAIHGDMKKALPGLTSEIRDRREHILMGSLGFVAGGGEIFPIFLANVLAEHGHRVSMLCINLNELNEEVLARLDTRVAVYDAAEAKMMGPRKFLNSVGASLVHSHVINIDDLFFKGPNSLEGFPYVVTLHGSHEGGNPEIEGLLLRMLRRVSRWVYLADKNLQIFSGAPLERSAFRKIANAMPRDDRPFPLSRAEMGIEPDAVVFVFVARGIERKGWRAAIEALRLLKNRHPQLKVHLLMAGDGPKTDEISANAPPDLPVTFLGFQSCINGLYRLADCALVPTRFGGESFPLCIIQALHEGVPIIATDVGEIRTMITRDGEIAGMLVDNIRKSELYFEEIYTAMLAMTDPTRRARAAALAAELGRGFDMAEVMWQYLDVYGQCQSNH